MPGACRGRGHVTKNGPCSSSSGATEGPVARQKLLLLSVGNGQEYENTAKFAKERKEMTGQGSMYSILMKTTNSRRGRHIRKKGRKSQKERLHSKSSASKFLPEENSFVQSEEFKRLKVLTTPKTQCSQWGDWRPLA
ncbi:hypothetical protein Y1Q_0024591 [Alligator mississippiensis]|uniref:Uncharacterized protein n=1 Tax=Alligator mississippiensis TaxID=8496 RepID=A0A151NB03_ALLMI|nr:hypothetical protein Y1Q_0024591 [Alligator mississippiensis]